MEWFVFHDSIQVAFLETLNKLHSIQVAFLDKFAEVFLETLNFIEQLLLRTALEVILRKS